MRYKTLLLYFIIAFAGAWLMILPYIRIHDSGLLPFNWPIPFFIAATLAPFTGPFLAAFVTTAIVEGKEGVRKLLSRLVLWKVGFQWYLFALIGIPLITIFGAILIPGALDTFQLPTVSLLLMYPLTFIITLIIGGPLGEEPGWRGFALPRMQAMQGPLMGTLVLGFIWALWHLPYFWIPEWGTPKENIYDIIYFFLGIMAVNVIYTWAYNHTKESLVIVILIHASNDAFFLNQFFSAPIVANTMLPYVIGFGITALFLIIYTKGKLGR